MNIFIDYKRNFRSYYAIGMVGLFSIGIGSCDDKGGEPIPLNPKQISEYTIEHVNVFVDIEVNAATSTYKKSSLLDSDSSIANAFDIVAFDATNTKVSTTLPPADEAFPFSMTVHSANIQPGKNSRDGGEYWMASKEKDKPAYTFTASKEEEDITVRDEIVTAHEKIIRRHIKKINLFLPTIEDGGVRIIGSRYQNPKDFRDFVDNSATLKSSKAFSSRRVLYFLPSERIIYKIIP